MQANTNKLSPSLKMSLLNETGVTTKVLNLLVQTKGVTSEVLHDQLSNMGGEIRAEAGDIMTITFPANQLPKLTNLDFVIYIELSSPLSTEGS